MRTLQALRERISGSGSGSGSGGVEGKINPSEECPANRQDIRASSIPETMHGASSQGEEALSGENRRCYPGSSHCLLNEPNEGAAFCFRDLRVVLLTLSR